MNAQREGFSLVEVIVAIVLAAIILVSLAGFTFLTARQAILADGIMSRDVASLEVVNRLTSMPYTLLPAATVRDTVGTAGNLYERRIDRAGIANGAQLTVTTTPLQRGVPASVVTIVRSVPPPPGNPLCNPSC
jgi:prepilin-type N-terminal cleavage/methylation domain-containing protein